MLDSMSGIEALVKPYNRYWRAYEEYEPRPGSQERTIGKNTCYIEAVSNERYEIAVKLPRDFDLKDNEVAQVFIRIDGVAVDRYTLTKRCRGEIQATRLGVGLFQGRRKHFGYQFNELTISKTGPSSMDEKRQAASRGIIRVTVVRGRPGGLSSDFPRTLELLPDRAPEDIVIEKGKTHGLKLAHLQASTKREFHRVLNRTEGQNREPTIFTFLYTSREFLERKKIVPVVEPGAPVSQSSEQQASLRRSPRLTQKQREDHSPQDLSYLCQEPLPRKTKKASPILKLTQTQTLSAQAQKRKLAEVEECCADEVDDEEPLPQTQVKTETPLNAGEETASTSTNSSSATKDATATPRVHTPPNETVEIPPPISTDTTTLQANTTLPKQNETAKKKARLMLQLERIEAEKRLEEIQIRQQLMELDDEQWE